MRKHPFQIILVLILCGTFLTLAGCKKKESSEDNNSTPQTGSYSVITGIIKDGLTLQPLTSSKVTLLNLGGTAVKSIITDASGKYQFTDIPDGKYMVLSEPDNYNAMTADSIDVNASNPKGNYVAICPVDKSITVPISCISGIILDKSGNPLNNALVSISSDPESYTNGYFASALTDEKGEYVLPGIALSTGSKSLIPAFKLQVVKDNYATTYIKGIVLKQNRMKVKNFAVEAGTGGNVIFQETFESETGWTYTGFWHRQANASVKNSAYPQYVKLGAGDNTGGNIPSAYAGTYDAWFGEASTGNYMGTPESGQDDLSGGTSTESHEGDLTSPKITLTSSTGHAALTFYTWFEIESVNPNADGYDIMDVQVIDMANPDSPVSLGRLNPYSDPTVDNRDAIPYTSGGFNVAPVWKYQQYDLSGYVGKTVKLNFNFNTVDALYNGFRGWFIDNIKITDVAVKSSGIPHPDYTPLSTHKR